MDKISKAVLIGIQEYKNSGMGRLDGPHTDVENMEQFVKSLNPNTHIVKIMDRPGTISPTRNNILHELGKIYEGVNSGDSVMVYYSGHGSNVRTTEKDEYDQNVDQAMNVLGHSRIVDNELHDVLMQNMPQNVNLYCVFDCCHSGDLMDLKYKFIDNGFQDIRPSNKTHDNRVVMVSGCAFTQCTTDAPKGGAFTNRFLDIMRENSNQVSFQKLHDELYGRLNYLKVYFGMAQEPQIFCSHQEEPENCI